MNNKIEIVELDNEKEINEAIDNERLNKLNSINLGEHDEYKEDEQQISNA